MRPVGAGRAGNAEKNAGRNRGDDLHSASIHAPDSEHEREDVHHDHTGTTLADKEAALGKRERLWQRRACSRARVLQREKARARWKARVERGV